VLMFYITSKCDKRLQAHAPSLGCCGVVEPGRPVLMSKASKSTGITSHVVQLGYEVREDDETDTLVCTHPRQAELISKALLTRGCSFASELFCRIMSGYN
jgi:hypothetical protein